MSAAGASWVAIQHVPFEGPGTIATTAALRGTPLRACRLHAGDPLPALGELRGLVVMGGPMGVSDTAEHPYLTAELELIAAAVTVGLPVLGVCLGAQLLAAALGGRVYRGAQAEIGPGRVALTAAGRRDPVLGATVQDSSSDPQCPPPRHQAGGKPSHQTGSESSIPVIHWHQDTFELPPGAVRLARSALYPNQAFRVGRHTYGLQFHLEIDRALASGWREQLPAGVAIGERARADVERVGRASMAAFFDLAG